MSPANPLGKQIQPGRSGPWLNIVGVAANVKNSGLAEQDDPEFYVVRKHAAESAGRTATAILRRSTTPRQCRDGFARRRRPSIPPYL